jgi:DUF4097 and DUF4098 domain-containing protein YvlB
VLAVAGCISPGFSFEPGDTAITRDGPFWVQTVSGSEPLPSPGRLVIEAPANVTVQGSTASEVAYTVTKRVKARTENDARRLLEETVVRISGRDPASLKIIGPAVVPEIKVTAPRIVREVRVSTPGGNVAATDLDNSLAVETGGGRMNVNRIGGTVTARTAGGDIILGTVGGSVRCVSAGGPIRADVIRGEAVFETAGGEIIAQEVSGAVRATTAGGGIHIQRAGGPVNADTAGGPIDIANARGMVTARNSGGPIRVGAANGVRCETAAGAIRLMNISGSLRATTAVGNIIAQLIAGPPLSESFLTTGGGDITVYLPSNLGVTIRAQTDAGGRGHRIVSDFPDVVVKTLGSLTQAEGQINGGGPVLRLSNSRGMIYIRRE